MCGFCNVLVFTVLILFRLSIFILEFDIQRTVHRDIFLFVTSVRTTATE